MKAFHLVSSRAWDDSTRFACALCSSLNNFGCEAEIKKIGFGTFARNFSLPILLAKAIEKANDDVAIHTYNIDDAYLALKARKLYKGANRIKLVCSILHAQPAPDNKLRAMIVDETDALLFSWENDKKIYLSGAASGKEKISVIGSGVEIHTETQRDYSLAKLIFAGEITPESHFDRLIKALGELKDLDWTLEVCGEGRGNYVMPCIRTARDRGINERINWRGEYNPDQLINTSNIGVLPTPLQALEFMANGLAVIALEGEMIQHEYNGIISNPDALEINLRRLISDKAMRQTLGKNAYLSCKENYNIEIISKRILDIYHKL